MLFRSKDYLKELTQLQHELARLENNVSTVILKVQDEIRIEQKNATLSEQVSNEESISAQVTAILSKPEEAPVASIPATSRPAPMPTKLHTAPIPSQKPQASNTAVRRPSQTRPVPQRPQSVKPAKPKQSLENTIGKNIMGIMASLLIFVSQIGRAACRERVSSPV